MSKEKLYIFDTTLRDGAQTQGVDFSIDDKEKISNSLDALGVDYIEGVLFIILIDGFRLHHFAFQHFLKFDFDTISF